jgi:hypothetical protein
MPVVPELGRSGGIVGPPEPVPDTLAALVGRQSMNAGCRKMTGQPCDLGSADWGIDVAWIVAMWFRGAAEA